MNAQGMFLKLTILLIYSWTAYSFVLMESDSNDSNDRNLKEKIVYLINVLQKVKELTTPDFSSSGKRFDDFDLQNIDTDSQDLEDWLSPLDKSYEHVINIQKKDYAILPPDSEWCRLMGFRRCRSNS